jgi:UDP-2,4-diacetamido-2,4,6-trideoxy-beta-L-altropyranose hydrolase
MFVCSGFAGRMIDVVEERGYPVTSLRANETDWTPEADAIAVRQVLEGTMVDWLVVDRYAIAAPWERAVRPFAARIMVVDDLADRPHACDLLLDQNYYRDSPRRYDGLVPDDCRKLFGPGYALIDPAFAAGAPTDRGGRVTRVMVAFGGSDPTGETGKILDMLPRLPAGRFAFDVVIGAANPQADALVARAAKMDDVVVHRNVAAMAPLMAAADIALGAGGVTTWERLCARLPAITVAVSDSQVPHLGALALDGNLLYLGRASEVTADQWGAALMTVALAETLRAAFAASGAAMVDGRGVERVVAAMEGR